MQATPHHDTRDDAEPRDDLDVAYSIVRSSEYSDLLEQLNLGTGYYSDDDLALQMRNVRKGIITEVAFSETLRKRAVQETKVKLADEGFAFYDETTGDVKQWDALDEDDIDERGRTTALFERGDEIWDELSNPRYSLSVEQAAAIDEKTSLDPFKPIFNHLAAAYHDSTKSKGGRTQDNFFGRVRRHEMTGEGDHGDAGLLGRARGGSS